jgi:thiamine biosynthesis lipoprotein
MALNATNGEAPVALRTQGDYSTFEFTALGTACAVVLRAASCAAAAAYRDEAVAWVRGFEARFSKYQPGSLVSRLNRSSGGEGVELDADGAELVALCDWFHWLTGGAFDPTTQPLLDLWDYHRVHDRPPTEDDVRRARGLVGWSRVERQGRRLRLPVAGMALDLGGIGKEYAVDRVTRLALDRGIGDILVDFGHDLRVHGHPPQGGAWRIGLEDPRTPGRCWGGVALEDGAVCGSGNYLRYAEIGGRRFGHIVDPRTGWPVENGCQSVTVIAPSCTLAGALSTAAFVLGSEQGLDMVGRVYGAEACAWTGSGLRQTGGFQSHVTDRAA